MLKTLLKKLIVKIVPKIFWNVNINTISIKEGENFGEVTFPRGGVIFLEKLTVSSNTDSEILLTFYNQTGNKILKEVPLELVANGGFLSSSNSPLYNKFYRGIDLSFLADNFSKIEVKLGNELDSGKFVKFAFLCYQLELGV